MYPNPYGKYVLIVALKKNLGITQAQGNIIVDQVVKILKDTLIKKGSVVIPKLGRLEVIPAKPYYSKRHKKIINKNKKVVLILDKGFEL